jgi:hypothetical protein
LKESFLHYIWQSSQFDHQNLQTTSGQKLGIIKPGLAHSDGGPDFQNALISIENHKWAGHVEIHINSSDWFKHNHHLDAAYDGTVLHVVHTHDAEVKRTNNTVIPCLELRSIISDSQYQLYESLTNNSHQIPCENLLPSVPNHIKTLTLEARSIERLEAKSLTIYDKLKSSNHDWQEVLYQLISRSFGMRINALPFELLAKQLPLSLLSKYKNQPDTIVALFFGVAGFLHGKHKDNYPKSLYSEFSFYQQKHNLLPIPISSWKFLRLRPANFPPVRIAQLAAVIFNTDSLFGTIKDKMRLPDLQLLFDKEISKYWETHYRFDVTSNAKQKRIGSSLIHSIIINAIVPVYYSYGLEQNDLNLQEICLDLLSSIPAEQNTYVNYYKNNGVQVDNALQSQGVLQLHQKFCIFKNCLNCQIGHAILKRV